MWNSRVKTVAIVIGVIILVIGIILVGGVSEEESCLLPSPSSTGGLVKPTRSRDTTLTSPFGPRDGGFHRGIDLAGKRGTPIYAMADGVVLAAQDQGVEGFGGWVVIGHRIDGREYSTVYGHMDPGGVRVVQGQHVAAGDNIATIGNSGQSTGPHVHVEVWEGNRLDGGTAVDPLPWVKKAVEPGSAAHRGQQVGDVHHPWTAVQMQRAAQIVAVGHHVGAPREAIEIALAVGLVESGMRNLASSAVPESLQYPHDDVVAGDADSVGIMQQRPSQGWGSVRQLMDPSYQAAQFFTRLLATPWQEKTFSEAAADVQRPAYQYRSHYGEREEEAKSLYLAVEDSSTSNDLCAPSTSSRGEELALQAMRIAVEQKGKPYIWGGGNWYGPTGGGFDCSGLVLYAYYQASGGEIAMGHYTGLQVKDPHFVTVPWEERRPGDVLFFGPRDDPQHVSIYIGDTNGVPMQVEAQQSGVPVGVYPVRFGELIQVRRVQ